MASKEELIKELSDAIVSCKKDRVIAAVEKAKGVMEPAEIIEKGLAAGMNEVGILFERGKIFLPHVRMAADAMNAGIKILEAEFCLHQLHSFFSLHKTQLALKILACKEPWKIRETFPLYPRYEDMINSISKIPNIEILAFIGCGPLPVTLLLFSKLYGVRCISVGHNPEVVVLVKAV